MWEIAAVGIAGAIGGFANVLSDLAEDKGRAWRAATPSVAGLATVGVGIAAGVAFWAINNGGLDIDTQKITAGHIGGALITGFGGVAFFRQVAAKREEAKSADEASAAVGSMFAAETARLTQESERAP